MDYEINEDVAPEMVWADLETLGLNDRTHPIIEAGLIVTNRRGVERARISRVIGYSTKFILPLIARESLDPVIYEMHSKNGLLEEVEAASGLVDLGHQQYRRPEVERELIEWLDVVTNGAQQYAMAGASIHFDRRFLAAQMPRLESWFHYRNYDVSTILALGSLVGRKCEFKKRSIHRTLPDIEDEIAAHKWAVADLVAVA